MTVDCILSSVNEALNIEIVKDNTVIATYDGRNSIPIVYNHMEVRKIIGANVLKIYV